MSLSNDTYKTEKDKEITVGFSEVDFEFESTPNSTDESSHMSVQ